MRKSVPTFRTLHSSWGFPEGVRFTPFLFLRNTTDQRLRVKIELHYSGEEESRSVQVPCVESKTCDSNDAGIDLADGTFSDIGLTANGY
ncbi:MAG: hypothetical protein ACE5JX_10860, partial [Acidobacteriota bacterium]